MKEHRNDNNVGRDQRLEKKRRTLRRAINRCYVLCSCLAAMVLTIGLITNDFLWATGEQPDAGPSSDEVVGLSLKISPTAEAQSNRDETAWQLILVNKWNCLPEDYEVELTELENGQSVDRRISPALREMFDAARSEGVYPVVVSGYRTAEKQQGMLDDKIAEYRAQGYSEEETMAEAEAWVAIPGTSEHQLGIAVDINADGVHSAGYEVYEWLEQNACKYGFILRYPADKTELTGVSYEPWHYRYVGIEAAAEIQNQGVCLEEYLKPQIERGLR